MLCSELILGEENKMKTVNCGGLALRVATERVRLCALVAVVATGLSLADSAHAVQMYGISSGGTLYTIETPNGAVVSSVGTVPNIAGLGFTPLDGFLYGTDRLAPSSAYKINPANGSFTLLGSTGLDYGDAATVDP